MSDEQEHYEDVTALLSRIDALQELLAKYRTGGRPSEALFKRLERTKKAEDRIRAKPRYVS